MIANCDHGVQPGFVDTAMMKTDGAIPPIVKHVLVSSVALAAKQILRAVRRPAKHVSVTKRYGVIAFALRLLPRPGNSRPTQGMTIL